MASVASLSTEQPSVSRMPQCPWSVYSSTHRSAISTTSSPTSSRNSPSATWTMPSGFHASEPSASLRAGTPKRIAAGTPRSRRRRTSARSEATVCCTTPGSDGTGCGSSMPSRTNSGATRSSMPSTVSATSRRSAAVRRRRRGRWVGKATAGVYERLRPVPDGARRRQRQRRGSRAPPRLPRQCARRAPHARADHDGVRPRRSRVRLRRPSVAPGGARADRRTRRRPKGR